MANQIGDTISKGHYFNVCTDEINKTFETRSFYTDSEDVKFADGKNAENKIGAINGISSSTTANAEDVAASIKRVNEGFSELNSNLTELTDSGNVQSFSIGEDGFPYITYKVGADSVTKKLGKMEMNSAIFSPNSLEQTAPCSGQVMGFGNYTSVSAKDNFTLLINGITPTDLQVIYATSTMEAGYMYMLAECKEGDIIRLKGNNTTNGMVFFS